MAVKFLVSGKTGTHLPYTDASGKPDHRLMGAAWAALHKGYRGNTYQGPNKQGAIDKLTAQYKAEKVDTPAEAAKQVQVRTANGESLMYEADGSVLRQADSYNALRCRVADAIQKSIDAGEDMDLDGDNDQYCYCYVCDLYPDMAVYSMNGEMFRVQYHDTPEGVVLGTPVAVELSYTDEPAAEAAQESARQRVLVIGCTQLQESFSESDGELTVTVIEPGFNKSKSRYYPPAVLKRDFKIFEGAKMFADHQTDAQAKAQPEGSVNNWVGSLKQVWAEESGTVKGRVAVIDPAFKAKLTELNKQNMLTDMGISIRAIGEASDATTDDGDDYKMVESLITSRSVDFVTFAGAGGRVEAMESEEVTNDIDLVTEAELRSRRPDLVNLIESTAQRSNAAMKTAEQQLQEANATIADLNKKVQESEAAQKKTVAAAELTKLLTESKLPEVSKARIRKQFENATETKEMKEAVASEQEYLKSLKVVAKNNGATENGVEEGAGAEKKVDDKQLMESFVDLGLTEDQAKIAIRGL